MFNLLLCTTGKVFANTHISSASFATARGEIEVHEGHAELVGVLTSGILTYHTEGNNVVRLIVEKGLFEIRRSGSEQSLVMLCDKVTLPEKDIGFYRDRLAAEEAMAGEDLLEAVMKRAEKFEEIETEFAEKK